MKKEKIIGRVITPVGRWLIAAHVSDNVFVGTEETIINNAYKPLVTVFVHSSYVEEIFPRPVSIITKNRPPADHVHPASDDQILHNWKDEDENLE